MDPTMVSNILERFGFPVLCTVVLGFVLYRLATWAMNNVANPLIAGHTTFLKSVQDTNIAQVEILKGISLSIDGHKMKLDSHGQKLEVIERKIDGISAPRGAARGTA